MAKQKADIANKEKEAAIIKAASLQKEVGLFILFLFYKVILVNSYDLKLLKPFLIHFFFLSFSQSFTLAYLNCRCVLD